MDACTPQQACPPAPGAMPAMDGALQPSDLIGARFVLITSMATAAGLWLSASVGWMGWMGWMGWVAGQALLAVALLQWFILLHEAGHLTLFRTRGLNIAAGHVAGWFALIPFESWRRVHGLHHVWTGWQDLDPTTAALAPRPRSRLELAVVDVAWRSGLPLFSIVYRLANYWNVPRLRRLFTAAGARRAVLINVVGLALAYGALAWIVGPAELLRLAGAAILLSLALQDPLILSQHTHLEQHASGGNRVTPFSPAEQARYTRSLRFPTGFAHWVLINFNAHELHHRCAGVPGYRLGRIAHDCPNQVDWWTWLCAAKRLPGSVLLFRNRDTTGFRL